MPSESPKIIGNPECSEKHRCGNCVRDVQARVHHSIQVAKLASKALPDGQRICCTCGKQKTLEEFSFTHLKNYSYRCAPCEREVELRKYQARKARGPRGQQRATFECTRGCGTRVSKRGGRCLTCFRAQRIVPKPKATPRAPSPLYPCINECGVQLSKPDSRCTQCRRHHNQSIAANANHALTLSRVMRAFAKGTSHGIMLIGDETWSLSWRCPAKGCGKPMLVNSRCYTHATGNPYTLDLRARIVSREEAVQAAS